MALRRPRRTRSATGPRAARTARTALTADPSAGETRGGLLASAAEVFGEVGFRNARVRDICRRAGANVAAVNYHFGSKEALYAEVLKRNLHGMLERFPPDGGVEDGAPPERRLHGFIRSFLRRILATGPDTCEGRLLAREMIEPTPALDLVVQTEIRALTDRLEGIIRPLLGAAADAAARRVCMASVVSQVVFFQHCRPVVSRLFPDFRFEPEQLELLADHITRFSLAGIRGVAAPPGPVRPASPARERRRPSAAVDASRRSRRSAGSARGSH